jgi:hypothetical protein
VPPARFVAVVALVAVDAFPVKAPTKVVVVNVPDEGLNVSFVEATFSDVIVPEVALVNVRYLFAFVVVSSVTVRPAPAVDHEVVVPLVVRYLPELPV